MTSTEKRDQIETEIAELRGQLERLVRDLAKTAGNAEEAETLVRHALRNFGMDRDDAEERAYEIASEIFAA